MATASCANTRARLSATVPGAPTALRSGLRWARGEARAGYLGVLAKSWSKPGGGGGSTGYPVPCFKEGMRLSIARIAAWTRRLVAGWSTLDPVRRCTKSPLPSAISVDHGET
jgi:hypothetical protein